MRTWTTSTLVDAAPDEVIDVLTDPAAAMRWSPFPFEVEGLDDGERLEAGIEARVSGSLGGMRVGFDLDVHDADEEGLRLTARGPIGFDVVYGLLPTGDGRTDVLASVSVHRGGGITGRVLERAADALLAAGALRTALGRIAREAEAACAVA